MGTPVDISGVGVGHGLFCCKVILSMGFGNLGVMVVGIIRKM